MPNPTLQTDLPDRVARLIGPELADVEDIFRAELSTANPCISDVYAHVSRFRGKRLRPMLLLLSASAAGEINRSHKVLAAVVEMIHTATLVHDDVLDEADTRRHVATVNHRWNNETSVLFGDYLFTHAFHLASTLETTLACRLIGRSTNRVCEGELSQIHQRGNFDLSEEAYLEIIDAKTAELCALCGFLGAHYTGGGRGGERGGGDADESLAVALRQYGRALGIAFQIADDLLDILGSESEMGKTLGSDFEKQKLTLPLIRLLATGDKADVPRIRELLARADDDSRRALRPFLEQSDAVEYTHRRALDFAEEARLRLAPLPDTPARRLLEEITHFAVQRNC